MVNLFELVEDKVVLTEICYTSKTFKEVMKVFKKDKNYMKVFQVLFYLTCPDKKRNPYWDLREDEKEAFIIKEADINFSIDEPIWEEALEYCRKLYETPHRRIYLAGKTGLDKLADYLKDTKITTGNDGNDEIYMNTMSRLGKITTEFAQLQKIHDEEVTSALRGGAQASYDEDK